MIIIIKQTALTLFLSYLGPFIFYVSSKTDYGALQRAHETLSSTFFDIIVAFGPEPFIFYVSSKTDEGSTSLGNFSFAAPLYSSLILFVPSLNINLLVSDSILVSFSSTLFQ